MAIKYKVVQKGLPGKSGSEKKFYASAKTSGEKTLAALTRDIEKVSGQSSSDVKVVINSLVDIIQKSLSDGQAVRLGDLGSFRVSISSEGKSSEKEVNAKSIKNSKIVFTPGKSLKTMLSDLKYEKI